ncbi:MAG TPA: hypothetical protein VF707_10135, partial [Ardenticatenaceae bacterium]
MNRRLPAVFSIPLLVFIVALLYVATPSQSQATQHEGPNDYLANSVPPQNGPENQEEEPTGETGEEGVDEEVDVVAEDERTDAELPPADPTEVEVVSIEVVSGTVEMTEATTETMPLSADA